MSRWPNHDPSDARSPHLFNHELSHADEYCWVLVLPNEAHKSHGYDKAMGAKVERAAEVEDGTTEMESFSMMEPVKAPWSLITRKERCREFENRIFELLCWIRQGSTVWFLVRFL